MMIIWDVERFLMNVGKRSGVIIEERMVGLIFMDLKGLEIGF